MNRKILKIVKIALGSTIAISLAYMFHLEYPVSAGIIALLSIQDTKKATVKLALKRVLAFAVTCIIAYFVFAIFGYTAVAYGVYLLLFACYCIFAGAQDALAMNAVLTTHFFLEQSMGIEMIGNEALLLLIGSGIGIVINLYIPNNIRQIRQKQKEIEECMKAVLRTLANQMDSFEKDEEEVCVEKLKTHIASGMDYAYTNMNNTFFQDSEYFIQYMQMRKQQLHVINTMLAKVNRLSMTTEQSSVIAFFIRETEKTLAESNNAERLLEENEILIHRCQNGILPKTREEFETRAILYVVLMDFREFLQIKKEFADSLTNVQKVKYWGME